MPPVTHWHSHRSDNVLQSESARDTLPLQTICSSYDGLLACLEHLSNLEVYNESRQVGSHDSRQGAVVRSLCTRAALRVTELMRDAMPGSQKRKLTPTP